MTVREIIKRLESAPQDLEFRVKTDGTAKTATLIAFNHEDGTETELIVSQP